MGKTYRREKEYSRKELKQNNSRMMNSVSKKYNEYHDAYDAIELEVSLTTKEIKMITDALLEVGDKEYDELAIRLRNRLRNVVIWNSCCDD